MHAALVAEMNKGESIESAIRTCFPKFTGAFSLLLLTKNKLIALRDHCGIRPLCLGQLNGGWVFSSETCALDTIGAKYVRDVNPGEMLVADHSGLTTYQLAKASPKLDIFEFVYFSRPDSVLLGKSVNEVRRNFGINLAKQQYIPADLVVPVPDSAIPAALGYAQESNIPFDHGLIKNRYIHRTFIRPAQKLREHDVAMKLNPLPEVLVKKSVIIIDDSIVRGTTSKKLVQLIKSAGASKVHLLISSPPIRYPDFYGIDIPSQQDLISFHMTESQIAKHIGADSVHFLSYKNLIKSTGLPESVFNTSCFTGVYPIPIGKQVRSIVKSRQT
jgi:amidophosphoribosyltransferase